MRQSHGIRQKVVKKVVYFKKRLDSNGKRDVTYTKSKKGNNSCSKCGKIPASIEYNGKKYCTWYCAKKKESFFKKRLDSYIKKALY